MATAGLVCMLHLPEFKLKHRRQKVYRYPLFPALKMVHSSFRETERKVWGLRKELIFERKMRKGVGTKCDSQKKRELNNIWRAKTSKHSHQRSTGNTYGNFVAMWDEYVKQLIYFKPTEGLPLILTSINCLLLFFISLEVREEGKPLVVLSVANDGRMWKSLEIILVASDILQVITASNSAKLLQQVILL